MAETSVAGFIKSMNTTKTALEEDVIKKTLELVQSKPYDPASELIDLIFAVTKYSEANVPGGEAYVTGQCISKLVKYLTLRSAGERVTNDSPLADVLLEFVRESARLYSEYQANHGIRVVEKRS